MGYCYKNNFKYINNSTPMKLFMFLGEMCNETIPNFHLIFTP